MNSNLKMQQPILFLNKNEAQVVYFHIIIRSDTQFFRPKVSCSSSVFEAKGIIQKAVHQ